MSTTTTTPTATSGTPTIGSPGASTTLAPWSSGYVQSMLGQASALAQQPYQWYQGAMTAGSSPLQAQAFTGLGSLQMPSAYGTAQQGLQQAMTGLGGLNYQGGGDFSNQFTAPGAYQAGNITTGQWNQQAAQQYMNPYLQSSLDPQLDQARRQAEQTRMSDAARLAQAGAYGGSRQAIMESELNRNTLRNMADITGKGYFDAYNTGMQGFMTDQSRALDAQKATEQSRQFGAGQDMTAAQQRAQFGAEAQRAAEQSRQFGAGYRAEALGAQANAAQGLGALATAQGRSALDMINAQLAGGQIQRGIDQEGLDAEYALWAQAQQHPYTSLEFQKSMLAGLPTTISQGNRLDDLGKITAILGGAKSLNDAGLFDWINSQVRGQTT
jgi:hypothetical protein